MNRTQRDKEENLLLKCVTASEVQRNHMEVNLWV